MKIKVIEPGAFCAALALLVMLSLPAYEKVVGQLLRTRVSARLRRAPRRKQDKCNRSDFNRR